MNRISTILVLTLSAMTLPQFTDAQTVQKPVPIAAAGMLTCVVDAPERARATPNEGVLCDFIAAGDGSKTRYRGTIRDFGIDLAEIDGGHMTWLVRDPMSTPAIVSKTGIAGAYGALPAAPALQLADHAMVLSHEGGTGIILQPAMREEYGLNFAIGVKALTLVKL